MQDTVDLGFELKYENLCTALFMRRVVEEARHEWVGVKEWATDERGFLERLEGVEDLSPVICKQESDLEASVFYLKDVLGYLQLSRGQVVLRVAGSQEAAEGVEDRIKELLPEAALRSRVQVSFWYWANRRGFATRLKRLLLVPAWAEIVGNYPSATREALGRLITDGVEPAAGQLMIWFGAPGCGKTYALRALLREWRERFSLHYISDTESFFANGEYMLSVLLNEDVETWKLFILEDAGEFLLPDARQQMGQGFSRLLNASDGLIGQGLKTMFLITTNEPLSRLHPAVSRPGRCAVQLEFGAFSRGEANEWLVDQGLEPTASSDHVRLADLFAMARGESLRSVATKVGF